MSANFQQININGVQSVIAVSEGDIPTLIYNTDPNNTVWMSDADNRAAGDAYSVPLPPLATAVATGDADVYCVCQSGQTAVLSVMPGINSFFQFVTILAKIIEISGAKGNGLYVYGPGAPSPTSLVDSITATNATDPFGTPTFFGFTSYFGAVGSRLIAQLTAGFLNFWTEAATPAAKAFITGNSGASGGNAITITSGHFSSDIAANLVITAGVAGTLSGSPQVVVSVGSPVSRGGTVQAFEVNGGMASNPSAVGTAFTSQLRSDVTARWASDSNGNMQWGPGAGSPFDVSFGRPSTVGFLRVTGGFQVTNLIELFNQPVGTIVFETVAGTETTARFQMDNTGKMQWGTGAGAPTDLNLSRSATGSMTITAASASSTYLLNLVQTATAVGGAQVTMTSTGDFALAVYIAGDATNAPRVVMTGLSDIRFGPGVATNPDTILARTGVGILALTSALNINGGKAGNVLAVGVGPSDFAGTVYLEDATAPATPGTASALYSKTGKLHYVSEDGNDYNVGAKRVTGNPAQTISTNSFTAITGAAVTVPAQKCRIKIKIWYSSSASSGAPQFQFTFPTTTATPSSNICDFRQTGAAETVRASNSSAAIASYTPGAGPVYGGAGTNSLFEGEVDATFASQGTFQVLGLTSIAGNNYVVNTFYIDLLPEN